MIERFAIRFGLQFGVVDLTEVDDLPFAVLARWFFAEQHVPFIDRRIEEIAFLACRVLAGVIQHQLTPTPEMFRLSIDPLADSTGATDADFPEVDQESINRFAERMDQVNGAKNGGGG